MNPSTLAKRLGVDPVTLRRWTSRFEQFLSPGATPPHGQARSLTEMDVQVLHFIATMRGSGMPLDSIDQRLNEMQANEWRGLPQLPADWKDFEQTITVDLAAARAGEMAHIAVLQTELQNARQALQEAQRKADNLAAELEAARSEVGEARTESSNTQAKVHTLEVELERARGEIRELQARLSGFNMAYGLGREKPISVFVIILGALLIGALFVIVAVVVGALIG